MTEQRCSTCKYWTDNQGTEEDIGWCTRFPPTPVSVITSTIMVHGQDGQAIGVPQFEVQSLWPMTSGDADCGEHELT